MSKYAIVIETEPRVQDVRTLQHHLYEFNAEKTGSHDGNWLAIFLRDDSDSMVAGLYGRTWAVRNEFPHRLQHAVAVHLEPSARARHAEFAASDVLQLMEKVLACLGQHDVNLLLPRRRELPASSVSSVGGTTANLTAARSRRRVPDDPPTEQQTQEVTARR